MAHQSIVGYFAARQNIVESHTRGEYPTLDRD
jgi:hypothetical protein